MPLFRLSLKAEDDLSDITEYTLNNWGEKQTDRYLAQLENCCRLLAENPSLGRPCDEIRSGLRRMEQGKHVIFYWRREKGVLISRILHQSMLPEKHALEEEL